ncbi:MAG TPA: shikimate kinase [Pseudobdellovibrionaceae bacterium]|nr:shikimate kinase [Pseudobdellovibrionaceae bacterium]
MITVIVGHRGVGKKSLLKRLRWHLRDQAVEYFSLDELIEEKIGQSIQSLFTEHGERYFRNLEKQVFTELIQKSFTNAYIVVSSGFDLSAIPEDCQVLWLQRKTDRDGRILLGRSVVNRKNQSLKDYHLRAEERNFNFLKKSNWIYEVPEGDFQDLNTPMDVEHDVLFGKNKWGGYFEIDYPVSSGKNLSQFFKERYSRYLNKDVFFVLNTYQIPFSQFLELRQFYSEEKLVLYISNQEFIDQGNLQFEIFESLLLKYDEVHLDPKLKLSIKLKDLFKILGEKNSLVFRLKIREFHEMNEFQEYAKVFNAHMLCQSVVSDFFDFLEIYNWWQLDTQRRSLLLVSEERRWDWVTLFLKGKQKISFWREGFYANKEGPSLFEWLLTPSTPKFFSVTLGDSVYSQPGLVDKSDFFKKDSATASLQVFVKRAELENVVLFFISHGVSMIDLQSPLMDLFQEIPWLMSVEKFNSQSNLCDTVFYNQKENKLVCFSAEENVFPEILKRLSYVIDFQKEIVIWSHRERTQLLQSIFPASHFFSARTGELRNANLVDQQLEFIKPKVLIWEPPRSSEVHWPPQEWSPDIVIDLNTQENSMGREYADGLNCAYVSGHEFSKMRTKFQISFWNTKSSENATLNFTDKV